MNYNLARNGQQLGIFSESEVSSKLKSGEILGTDLCWKEGMTDWQPVSAAFSSVGVAAAPINPYSAPSVDPVIPSSSSGPAELASPGTRLVAHLLDALTWIPVGLPFGIAFAGMDQSTGEFTALGLVLLGIAGLFAIALLGYTIYLLSTQGQTLGKRWMKVRIVRNEDDGNPGFLKAVLLRIFVNGLIGAIPILGSLYSLIDILFIFSADRRCLHDKIAGTRVISC